MARGDPYGTVAEMRERFDLADNQDDTELERALAAGTYAVSLHCRRDFNRTSASTSATVAPLNSRLIIFGDVHDTSDLTVEFDSDLDGTFPTAWTPAKHQLEPNEDLIDGTVDWPKWKARAIDDEVYPISAVSCFRRTVRVTTANWGWANVPEPVQEATFIIATEIFKMKDAPYGVAGWNDFGAMIIRQNPYVNLLLRPFRRRPVRIG